MGPLSESESLGILPLRRREAAWEVTVRSPLAAVAGPRADDMAKGREHGDEHARLGVDAQEPSPDVPQRLVPKHAPREDRDHDIADGVGLASIGCGLGTLTAPCARTSPSECATMLARTRNRELEKGRPRGSARNLAISPLPCGLHRTSMLARTRGEKEAVVDKPW